jgi:hypothetical protein
VLKTDLSRDSRGERMAELMEQMDQRRSEPQLHRKEQSRRCFVREDRGRAVGFYHFAPRQDSLLFRVNPRHLGILPVGLEMLPELWPGKTDVSADIDLVAVAENVVDHTVGI